MIFGPMEYNTQDRREWMHFFSVHRHLGFELILISQHPRLICRPIRNLLEYEVRHRKINNFGPLWVLPITIFLFATYWYQPNILMRKNFVLFRKKVAAIYDSYILFYDTLKSKGFNFDDEESDEADVNADVAADADGGVNNDDIK